MGWLLVVSLVMDGVLFNSFCIMGVVDWRGWVALLVVGGLCMVVQMVVAVGWQL